LLAFIFSIYIYTFPSRERQTQRSYLILGNDNKEYNVPAVDDDDEISPGFCCVCGQCVNVLLRSHTLSLKSSTFDPSRVMNTLV